MQSQMQSFNIKRPTKQSNQARASATLINYPTTTAAAVTIPSSYFVLTVSTNCYLYCSRSIPLLGLFTARSARSTMPFNCSDYSTTAILTDCYRLTAATKISAIKSSIARYPTTY